MLRRMVKNRDDIAQVFTTNVTDMGSMFIDVNRVNHDILNWDLSNVTNLREMLYDAEIPNNFVLLDKELLTTEITSSLKGISSRDVKCIFSGSEIVGTNKRKFYCANAGFLLNVILKSE